MTTPYVSVSVEPGLVELWVHGHHRQQHPALPLATSQSVHCAQMTVDPWVLQGGIPVEDPANGLEMASSAVCSGMSQFTGLPSPGSLSTGATDRWMAGVGVSSGAWRSDSGLLIDTSMSGAVVAGGYSYPTKHYGRLARPAFDFDSKGPMNFVGSPGPGRTMAFVLVPEHGKGPYYDILHFGNHCAIRYSKGRIEFFLNNIKIVDYQTVLNPGEPLIVAVAMQAGSTGRIVVLDRSHYTREFSTKALNTVNFGGTIGSSNDGIARLFADMALLEVDSFDSALSMTDLTTLVIILALCYGVHT